ncbi:hypothetical protein PENTCL1PPCAC_13754, partial [Pristionchus entomophagus]
LSKYSFEPVTIQDKEAIMEVSLEHFFTLEPHMRAFGITVETGRNLIDSAVSKSLTFPYSYKVVHKESEKIIGMRLITEVE